MTLPTRPDGGIDWDKVYPDWDHTSRFITINLAKEAVAHARERCARWHEEQQTANIKLMRNAPSRADYARFQARAYQHFESAAALRKMED